MNKTMKKVVGDLLPQLVMFLALAAFMGYYAEGTTGLKVAGIAILSHVGWAPVYYVYLKREARIEAAKEEQSRMEWEADAPNRAARLAIAKAIAGYADPKSQGPTNA